MTVEVVRVTKKGQATIPKRLREKFGIRDAVLVVETEEGILLKPVPKPEGDLGSLRELFEGRSSREILEEARKEERLREGRLLGR